MLKVPRKYKSWLIQAIRTHDGAGLYMGGSALNGVERKNEKCCTANCSRLEEFLQVNSFNSFLGRRTGTTMASYTTNWLSSQASPQGGHTNNAKHGYADAEIQAFLSPGARNAARLNSSVAIGKFEDHPFRLWSLQASREPQTTLSNTSTTSIGILPLLKLPLCLPRSQRLVVNSSSQQTFRGNGR